MNALLVASGETDLAGALGACGLQVRRVGVEGLTALAAPGAAVPGLVVVDRREGGEVMGALGAVKRQHPGMGVLVVLPALDAGLMLEALRAGVNECVAAPFTAAELQAAVARVVAAGRGEGRRGEVLAIVGAKGGVGATTVAVNVAVQLARVSQGPTLLVDLQQGVGDAGVYLGVEPRFSVADALANLDRLDAAVLKGLVTPTRLGVDLLGPGERTGEVAAARVRGLVEFAATQYGFVVLDVPRGDAGVLGGLDGAGRLVVVATAEVAAVRGAAKVAAGLGQRYGRERVQVVLTRYDEAGDIGPRDVERVVGVPVRYVVPSHYAVAVGSQATGRPLVLDNHTKLARALTEVARGLAGLPDEPRAGKKPAAAWIPWRAGKR